MDGPCAIGRIATGGHWIGFQADGAGYRLAVGLGDQARLLDADPDLLLALAIAYFQEAFDDPPPQIEATHADVSALVRHVAEHEPEPARRRLLAEAVDAIDDGLAGDAVVSRLAAARPGRTSEQAEAVDLLVDRVRSALGR